jgi:Domain of unknown function (DUF4352)
LLRTRGAAQPVEDCAERLDVVWAAVSASVAAAPSTPKAAPAGSAVRDGKFEFQVLDITRAKTVSDPTGNPYLTTTAQGEFIVITLAVRNLGDEPRSYFGSNQKFIDASGREFAPSSSADMWMNTADPMGDINPGNSIQVKVAFDVPPGTPTEGAVLEMHDSTLSGGVQAMRRSRTASARRSSVTISASFAREAPQVTCPCLLPGVDHPLKVHIQLGARCLSVEP